MVYRASGDSTSISRSIDIYYYSPNNEKFRSLREVKEYLEFNEDEEVLKEENFTFQRLEIHMNDNTKELVRTSRPRKKSKSNKYDKGKKIF